MRNFIYQDEVNKFLKQLSKDGFWGGEETIMAVSEMWAADNTIFYEKGRNYVIKTQREVALKQIQIVHRLKNKNSTNREYNHYDSLWVRHSRSRFKLPY